MGRMAASAPSSTQPHRIGRYAVFDSIGSGGTADVHLGSRLGKRLGKGAFVRMVAVKRLRADRLNEAEFVSMLIDEARLTARILHSNTVPVIDVVHTKDELLLVSEYVHGETLSTLLRAQQVRGERTPPGVAAAIAVGVLHGLHAAHVATDEGGEALGIIHRDVSPQNIMIAVDGMPRILDFGMAKARGRLTSTADGIIKGKLAYMAPEQMQAKKISSAVDIWAVGCVLWEMLTGKRLFSGAEQEMLEQILIADVSPPSRHAKDVSHELDEIVLRALSHDASQRFASADEMARALTAAHPVAYASDVGAWVEVLAGVRLAARAQTLSQCERAAMDLLSKPEVRESSAEITVEERPRRTSWLLLVAALAVLAGAITVVVMAFRARVPTVEAAPPVASLDHAAPKTSAPSFADPLPPPTSPDAPAPSTTNARRPVRAANPCVPPFVLDSQQRRIYKRECLK